MPHNVLYPLGIQTFSEIIEKGYLYVDKTDLIYQMTHDSRCVFLNRPRRFGKSLLTSTLKSYFEGRQDLFRGLAIEKMEKEWKQYPVLHFSLATAKHGNKADLESELNLMLEKYEAIYGRGASEERPNQRLMGLIERAYAQTGEQVVVLIDEYDAPLLDVIHEDGRLEEMRRVMQNFYSPFKDCDQYLRFLFLTGITKFSQLSIFSELNNLNNISMLDKYAAICGITEQEMIEQMNYGIEDLAEECGTSKEQIIEELKTNYDGYHFSLHSPDIYNPFSLLAAMLNKTIEAYWFGSGTPSFLVNLLDKFNVSPIEIGEAVEVAREDFDMPAQKLTDITPLLYQSGYYTIKGYDPLGKLYTLGIPNQEIRMGLFHSLLPNYVGSLRRQANTIAILMSVSIIKDDINHMLELLKEFLATVPYVDNANKVENYEGHWQQLLYVIFTLVGARCAVEVHTQKGRVDMVARSATTLYLFELKLNQSPETAMRQIDMKNYDASFALCGLPVVKVGINFSVEERNITGWEIQ